jgi:hypothetical protein
MTDSSSVEESPEFQQLDLIGLGIVVILAVLFVAMIVRSILRGLGVDTLLEGVAYHLKECFKRKPVLPQYAAHTHTQPQETTPLLVQELGKAGHGSVGDSSFLSTDSSSPPLSSVEGKALPDDDQLVKDGGNGYASDSEVLERGKKADAPSRRWSFSGESSVVDNFTGSAINP